MNKHTFASYHPAINFVFFAVAAICGMVFIHPAFLICSVFLSVAFNFTVRGRNALRFLCGMATLFVMISVINPLFNTRGSMILFTYFGRPYTAESLFYGMAIAGMLVSVIFWFSSYNEIMTSDKFIYIFGSFMPSLSLLLNMVLRFVPSYKRKLRQIGYARACIGKGAAADRKRSLAENGLMTVSALTSWALEGSIITSDSMRARGYGTGKRSRFAQYRFIARDAILIAVMLALFMIIIFCGINGAASAMYTPKLELTPLSDPYLIAGVASYAIFLFIPTVLYIREEITWLILKSRI